MEKDSMDLTLRATINHIVIDLGMRVDTKFDAVYDILIGSEIYY
jgi:hypothetical protein